jgi:zinc protease
MRPTARSIGIAALACLGLAACGRAAVEAPAPVAPLDRSAPPPIGDPPSLDLPPVQRLRLSNGLEVLLVEHREVPVVDVQLVVRAGAGGDPRRLAGRASLTADLLDEATATRGSLEIADALDFLGARLESGATWDASTVRLHVLTPRLAPALEIMADVIVNPTFPQGEFERKKQERLTRILQQADEARSVAANSVAAVLYGDEHPYGASLLGNRRSVEALDRESVEAFYRTYYHPGNAFMVVVGDVTAAALVPLLEQNFGGWRARPTIAAAVPALPPPPAAGIHLIDRPGAAQTELRVATFGAARASPDYFPILVMNTILGGSFTSRLNQTLREEKGYAYGASSQFDFRADTGPFVASAAVFTAVTDSALFYFMREIAALRDEPVPADELARAHSFLARGLPRRFETAADIGGFLAELGLYGLEPDFLALYAERVRAVTAEDVRAAARRYLDPARLNVVLVGDRAQIEDGIARLGIGAVQLRTFE